MFFCKTRQWRRAVKDKLVRRRLKNMLRWRYRRHFRDASLNQIQHPRWTDFIGTRLQFESTHNGHFHYHDEPRFYWQKIRKRRERRDHRFELAASEYAFQ